MKRNWPSTMRLVTNDSAVQVLGTSSCAPSHESWRKTVRANVTIDWTVRENVRANLRVQVERLLRRYGYPPESREKATREDAGAGGTLGKASGRREDRGKQPRDSRHTDCKSPTVAGYPRGRCQACLSTMSGRLMTSCGTWSASGAEHPGDQNGGDPGHRVPRTASSWRPRSGAACRLRVRARGRRSRVHQREWKSPDRNAGHLGGARSALRHGHVLAAIVNLPRRCS